MSTARRTRKATPVVQVKVNNPLRKKRRSRGGMSATVGFAATALGLVGAVLLGAPAALLVVAAGSGAVAGGTAYYAHRRQTRSFRAASKAQRERAERARRARIARERERTLDRQAKERAEASRPQVGPDSRIVTPSGCTPPCYGASKADPDGKCGCPCGGAHHGEGYRLRRERAAARRKTASKGK